VADVGRLCRDLFPEGHSIAVRDGLVTGRATVAGETIAILGTVDGALIGADLAFALAGEVLDIVERAPGTTILLLVDTGGQRLSRRDELLGNAGFLAHLAECFEVARGRGHRLVALVHGDAVSGAFLSVGLIADEVYALESATIRVMALPAMSRITTIPIERLESLSRSSPILGPGPAHYARLGAVEAVWRDDEAAQALRAALSRPPPRGDRRIALGAERGGRPAAAEVRRRLGVEP
jgi:malonate decarboxylase gamma subunit